MIKVQDGVIGVGDTIEFNSTKISYNILGVGIMYRNFYLNLAEVLKYSNLIANCNKLFIFWPNWVYHLSNEEYKGG
jgi:hypothetical protein